MALKVRDYTIIKVVPTTHHQAIFRYGTYSGKQCSGMSFMLVASTLLRSPRMWDTFDLD